MRNAEECLAKAAEMERLAERCDAPATSADYRYMAGRWRDVACQARWQDTCRTGAI